MHFGVIWGPQSYTSYNNVRNGPPSACTCLTLFANTHGNSEWAMFPTNTVYVQSAIWLTLYYVFTLHSKSTAYTPLQGPMSLKLKPHHTESCFPRFIAGIYTQKHGQLLLAHSALQLAAEHKAERTDQWKMRAQHSHIIQTSSGDQHSLLYWYLGLILGIIQPEGQAHD